MAISSASSEGGLTLSNSKKADNCNDKHHSSCYNYIPNYIPMKVANEKFTLYGYVHVVWDIGGSADTW